MQSVDSVGPRLFDWPYTLLCTEEPISNWDRRYLLYFCFFILFFYFYYFHLLLSSHYTNVCIRTVQSRDTYSVLYSLCTCAWPCTCTPAVSAWGTLERLTWDIDAKSPSQFRTRMSCDVMITWYSWVEYPNYIKRISDIFRAPKYPSGIKYSEYR